MPYPAPSRTRPEGAGDRWHPRPSARLRSWLVDWLVVSGWLVLLTLGGVLVRALVDLPQGTRTTTAGLLLLDGLVTVGTVAPFLLYLVLTQLSSRRATVGQRVAGLVLAAADGGRASAGQVWGRNVVKVLPWQLAHLGVSRAALEVQQTWGLAFFTLSLLLTAVVALPALVGGRGLHDRLAGTRLETADPRGYGRGPGRGTGPGAAA